MSTELNLKHESPHFDKPLLCAGLNEKTTTEIERLIWVILDKYQVNPMLQPNLTTEILKTCDAYLQDVRSLRLPITPYKRTAAKVQ